MAGYVPTGLAGGFSYTPVSYTYGNTTQNIGGGFTFNLPLDTVAAFTNAGLQYAQDNSANAQGFLSGVISQAQGNVGNAVSQSATYGAQAYNQGLSVQSNAIRKFFNGSGCFITTAVTSALGKADDCWELQALRKFRDEVIAATPAGVALIKQYYDLAPQIVAVIESKDDKASIYARLASLFIYPALQAISRGDNAQAGDLYKSMVGYAATIANLPLPAPVVEVAKVLAEAPAPTPVTAGAAPVTLESLAALVATLIPPTSNAAPVVVDIEKAVPVAAQVVDAVKQPTEANVSAVVEGLGTLATALIPGAAPVVAAVEAAETMAPVAEPLLTSALHSIENVVTGLFHHSAPAPEAPATPAAETPTPTKE